MPPPTDTPASPTEQALTFFRLPAAPGPARLMLIGELDLATADRARTAIRAAQDDTPELICDLGDVWFVDLSGLGVLLDAAEHARRTGGRLTVTSYPSILPRILRVLGLEGRLSLHPVPSSAHSHGCAAIRPHVT